VDAIAELLQARDKPVAGVGAIARVEVRGPEVLVSVDVVLKKDPGLRLKKDPSG
jgi:hypothetical protein